VPRLLPAAPGPLVKPAVEFLPYVHSWTKRTALLKIQVELPAVSTIPILGAMCSRHEGIPVPVLRQGPLWLVMAMCPDFIEY
jgi:hypothetical protein